MGIYKRKQESKKTRKKELDQDSDQENKETTKKKRKNFPFFLDHFLGRVLVFVFSYFLRLFATINVKYEIHKTGSHDKQFNN